MIQGTKYWDQRSRFYSQENNPTESYLKATMDKRGGWLESCGPTSAINCLSTMGVNVEIVCPGEYKPQPEEVLMDFFNDPRNKALLDTIRQTDDDIPENRVPQFYPVAVSRVFNAKARFQWELTWNDVQDYVRKGKAVQLCLKKPSHYVAVLAYDFNTRELIYNDPYGARFQDGDGGWNRRMGKKEFEANVKNYFIVYGI